ncbi:MAG: SEC-C metal-binding domain-containing protein [Myxococcota bacterium]
MGHAAHFLSRLDRLASADVEVALSLYRDSELVRQVLAHAGLPKDAERLALALSSEPGGPHLVVARDGGFVTCLGYGMSVGSLFVVTREKLDSVVGRVELQRRREHLADELAGGEGKGINLLVRLIRSDQLSREEMSGLLAFQPALQPAFFNLWLKNTFESSQAINVSLAFGKPPPPPKRGMPTLHEAVWALTTSMGHLAVLIAAIDGAAFFDRLDEDFLLVRKALVPLALGCGHLPTCVRSLWAAARLGKDQLQNAKARLSHPDDLFDLEAAALEVAAIGLGHAKLHAEARKALDRKSTFEEGEEPGDYAKKLKASLAQVMDQPEAALNAQLAQGRNVAVTLSRAAAEASPHRFHRPEDVPEKLARTIAVTVDLSIHGENHVRSLLFTSLPFLARCAAEDLYLPGETIAAWESKTWRPWQTQRLLHGVKASQPLPVRVEKKTERNAPCVCGSGKKYKKCCGAA